MVATYPSDAVHLPVFCGEKKHVLFCMFWSILLHVCLAKNVFPKANSICNPSVSGAMLVEWSV